MVFYANFAGHDKSMLKAFAWDAVKDLPTMVRYLSKHDQERLITKDARGFHRELIVRLRKAKNDQIQKALPIPETTEQQSPEVIERKRKVHKSSQDKGNLVNKKQKNDQIVQGKSQTKVTRHGRAIRPPNRE